MEAQVYLIGGAVVAISAVLIYFIAAVTMREKSYDEILEEQRKRRQNALGEEHKKPEKVKRKVKKRVKVEHHVDETDEDSGVTVEMDKSPPVTEVEPEPPVVEEVVPVVTKPTKQSSKSKKNRSANKEEKQAVNADSSPAAPAKPSKQRNAPEPKQEIQEKKIEKVNKPKEEAAPKQKEVAEVEIASVIVKESKLKKSKEPAVNVVDQEQLTTAHRRIKDLLQELSRERKEYSVLEKSSQDKVAAHVKEITTLHARLTQLQDRHSAEVSTLKVQMEQHKTQLNGEHTMIVRSVTDENQGLKEKLMNAQTQLKIVQNELNLQIQERTTAGSSTKNMESKCRQYEEKIRKLESSQHEMTQKYNQVVEQFNRETSKTSSISRDLEKATNEQRHADQEISNLQQMVKDRENQKDEASAELLSQLKLLEEKCRSLERTVAESQVGSAVDNSEELDEVRRQLEEKTAQAGDLAGKLSASETRESESKQQASSLEQRVSQVEGDLGRRDEEVSRLTLQLQQKAADVEAVLSSMEERVAMLKEQKERADQQDVLLARQDEVLTQRQAQIDTLTEQLSAANTSQDDQSQKLSEDLQAKQKVLDQDRAKLADDQQRQQDLVKDLDAREQSLQQREKELASTVTPADNVVQNGTSASSELQEANTRLEGQVLHYKSVLADTETILNKLQSSVESEEKKWQIMLQKQKNQSQEELQQAKEENQRLCEQLQGLSGSNNGHA